MQLEEKLPRIMVLCNGPFSLPSIQLLGLEKYLCAIGVGDASGSFVDEISAECMRADIPFHHFETRRNLDAMTAWLDEVKPDFVFSICFPFRIPEEVLAYNPKSFFNFHTGPLPAYRGPMPIFEVLRYQEPTTALTVHRMTAGFDEGGVVFSESLSIFAHDTFGSLSMKLAERCAYTTKNFAEMLSLASYIPETVQNENEARYFEYPEDEDTLVRWHRMPASEIEALIRACNPWNNGAVAVLAGRKVNLLEATIAESSHTTIPGEIIELTEDNRLRIACINGECLDVSLIRSELGFMTAQRFYTTALQKQPLA